MSWKYKLMLAMNAGNILMDTILLGIMLTRQHSACKGETYPKILILPVLLAITCGIYGLIWMQKLKNKSQHADLVTHTEKVGLPCLIENIIILLVWLYAFQINNCAMLDDFKHLSGMTSFYGTIVFTMYRSLDMYLSTIQDDLIIEDSGGKKPRRNKVTKGQGQMKAEPPRKLKRSMSITEVIVQSCGRLIAPSNQHKKL